MDHNYIPGQQTKIWCRKHIQEVLFFDMSSEARERLLCLDCWDIQPHQKIVTISSCLNQQNEDLKKIKAVSFMKEVKFNESIMKIIKGISSNLEKLLKFIQQQKSLIEISIQNLKEQCYYVERISVFDNYNQLEDLAQLHYELYYSQEINFEGLLNKACAPSYQEIHECCEQILSFFPNEIKTINMDLQMLANQMNSHALLQQTKNSIRLSVENDFLNLKNVLFDENGQNLLISNQNKIWFYKFSTDSRQFQQAGKEIQLVGSLQAICLQKKFEWFVESSLVKGQTEITFWDIKFDHNKQVMCSLSQKISNLNLNLQEIKQLAIDEKNSNLFIFTEFQFITITPLNNQENKKYVYQHQKFIKAELNSDLTLLSFQSQENFKYIIYVYIIPNLSKQQKPNQIRILNIQEERLFDFFFFTVGSNNYFLVYQNSEISIQQLQLNSSTTSLLYKLPVYSGSVIFNQNSLNISLMIYARKQFLIYKIIRNQNKEQEFEIKFLSQINSDSGLLNCFFSQNGKFLAVSQNLQFTQQLTIYSINHLPCFQIAPNKVSLSN